MLKRMNVVAQIGILSFSFLIGLTTWSQEKQSAPFEDFKPASTNQMGSEYPQVNSEGLPAVPFRTDKWKGISKIIVNQ